MTDDSCWLETSCRSCPHCGEGNYSRVWIPESGNHKGHQNLFLSITEHIQLFPNEENQKFCSVTTSSLKYRISELSIVPAIKSKLRYSASRNLWIKTVIYASTYQDTYHKNTRLKTKKAHNKTFASKDRKLKDPEEAPVDSIHAWRRLSRRWGGYITRLCF